MSQSQRSLLQITMEQASIADEVCSTLMGDDVEVRRRFIQTEREGRPIPRYLSSFRIAFSHCNGRGLDDAAWTKTTTAGIEPIEIQEEMERSFLEYSMSVIVSRALPDVRDGLKPVHRRILYGMWDTGLRARPATRQVRQSRRRRHGSLPSTR